MYEAVEKAGGMTSEAAQESVNLAQAIEDGQQLRIPSREEIRKCQKQGRMSPGFWEPEALLGMAASQLRRNLEAVQH